LDLIKANDGINDKARLARIVADAFRLTKNNKVLPALQWVIFGYLGPRRA
jgi:hypothetical protein